MSAPQSNEDVVLLRDANRYRFLRSRGPLDPITVESIGCCFLGGEKLDVAIDTEMELVDRNKTALKETP